MNASFFEKKLWIETPRLIIRNLQQSDLEYFHDYRSIEDNCKYQGYEPMDRETALEFIKKQEDQLFGKPGQWVQYAITSKELNHLIGDCAIKLRDPDPRIAEIGISISHRHQKQGYAKETMRGIIAFLFDDVQIHRVVETADVRNEASIRLLESVGFRKEGHFIEDSMFKGSWGSVYQYAMLEREWKQLNNNKK